MATKKDLQPHIFHPLPSPEDILKNQSKEQRLRTILSNLEKNNNAVRHRLITHAKRQSQLHLRSEPLPPQQPPDPRANDLLLANLNAPYTDGTPDPRVDPDAALPPPPADLRQATPPPEMVLAKEVLDQIELHYNLVEPTRKYYQNALKRMQRPEPSRSYSGVSNGPPANASPADPRLVGRGR